MRRPPTLPPPQNLERAPVQWGIPSVQWGIPSVQWGDNISTVEVAQYSGDKELITNFQRISKSFPELISLRNAVVKDLGYKNLVLGKILL